MRNYALTRAQSAESIGSSIAGLFHNWQARRETAKLTACDDQALKILGLTRSDVVWALRLPLTQNPRLALEERVFLSARGF